MFSLRGEGSNRRLISLRRLSLKAHPFYRFFFQRETVSLQLYFTLRFKPKSGHLKGRERKIPRLWLCRYPFPGNPQSAYSRCTLGHIDFTTTWDPNAVICIYGKGLYLEHSPAHWQIVGKKKKKKVLFSTCGQNSHQSVPAVLDKVVTPITLTLEMEAGGKKI